jgi:hypothetical protein
MVFKRDLIKGSPPREARASSSNIIPVRSLPLVVGFSLSSFNSRRCCENADNQPYDTLTDPRTAGVWFSFLTEQYRLPLRETSKPTIANTENSLAADARRAQFELPHRQSGLL